MALPSERESDTEGIWREQDRHPGDRMLLFSAVADAFEIERVLYPGSWADVAASFVFPDVVYVDNDRRAARFFADEVGVARLVEANKRYGERPRIAFRPADYGSDFGADDRSFDLLVSLYAGFVSRACKRYLRPGGLLLANNSHGDASMASIDPDFELVGAVNRRAGAYRATSQGLGNYLRPKRGVRVTRERLERTRKGVAYTRTAAAYLFRVRA